MNRDCVVISGVKTREEREWREEKRRGGGFVAGSSELVNGGEFSTV